MGDSSTTLVGNDGYVKFQAETISAVPTATAGFTSLRDWRTKLYDRGLLGMYPNGVGFGNLSVKQQPDQGFLVTATATGNARVINLEHCCQIIAYDFEKNWVRSIGLAVPSSECMSHAALYQALPEVRAIIHVHSLELWQSLRFVAPTTAPEVSYGTPAMARELIRLCTEEATKLTETKLIVMGGHEKGIITFGTSMDEAGQTLLTLLNTATV